MEQARLPPPLLKPQLKLSHRLMRAKPARKMGVTVALNPNEQGAWCTHTHNK